MKVKCPKCGAETDSLYALPSSREWMCEDCIFERLDMAHLDSWKDSDFEHEGVERIDTEGE